MTRRSAILARRAVALGVLLALSFAAVPARAAPPTSGGTPPAVRTPVASTWISEVWAAVARLWAPLEHLVAADDTSGDPTGGDGGLGPGSGGGLIDPNGAS